MKLELERVYHDAVVPTQGSNYAACYDLYAYTLEVDVKVITASGEKYNAFSKAGMIDIPAGARALIPTGFKMRCPEGYSIDFLPRSGMAYKEGVSVVNTPGVIDHDYSEQCYVALINTTENTVVIAHGQRIAQMRLTAIIPTELELVSTLSPVNSNRNGGFGSSGKF